MSVTARAMHGVNACLIPNPYNDHRPLALRHKPLVLVSALLVATKVAALVVIGLTPAQAELSTITVERITQLTNAERQKVGLAPLTTSSQLAAAAKNKGNHMLEEDYFAHISPSGVTPWFWITQQGYPYQVAGENLAIDFTEAEDVVAAWLASPGHKANMLHTDYTETGIAVATGEFQGGTSTVVVHMFGRPPGASASEPVSTPTPTQAPATPGPAPTQEPVSTPTATVTPEAVPPGTPRIALPASNTAIGSSAIVEIRGDSDTIAHVLINNQLRASVSLGASGRATAEVDVSDLPDGDIVLRAYGSDGDGNESAISDPVITLKDTIGPEVSNDQLAFLLSPLFDSRQAGVLAFTGEFSQLVYKQSGVEISPSGSLVTVLPSLMDVQAEFLDEHGNATTLEEFSLAPQYTIEDDLAEITAPERFNRLTRRMTAAILVSVLALLALAVLIRIRIQHPALITHATIVILLAAVLFVL